MTYRIGIDARFFRRETAGLGRYTRELIHALAAIDATNEYYVFLTEPDMVEWDLDQPNFHPVLTPASHYTKDEQTVFLGILNKHKLDLVHFLNFNHPLLYRRPFVVTLHDLTLYFQPAGRSASNPLRLLAFRTLFKRALTAAKKVIAISEYSAHDAVEHLGISHAKMEVVYEGGPQPLQEVPFGGKSTVQEYLGSKDPYFLFVSQWKPHKGIITLIDAFNEFKAKTGLPYKLVLAGKQQTVSEDIKSRLVSSPFAADILTPGFVPDELLPLLYYYSYCLVMPSENEGFGLPVLEALANGTVAIAAKNSSLPETLGDAGLYFETSNVQELADRMQELATEPELRNKLLSKAPAQLKKFSWHRCAQQTLKVYLSVLEKRR